MSEIPLERIIFSTALHELDVEEVITGWDTTQEYSSITVREGKTLPFTKAQLDAKIVEVEAAHAAQEYRRDRATLYPQLNEQFDLLYHAIDAGKLDKTSDFYIKLKKVKDDNPKPS